VFNKADVLADAESGHGLRVEYPGSFVVSALGREGLDDLRAFLFQQAAERGLRCAS